MGANSRGGRVLSVPFSENSMCKGPGVGENPADQGAEKQAGASLGKWEGPGCKGQQGLDILAIGSLGRWPEQSLLS